MTRPFISVIMPTFNGAKYLASAIDSVLIQKHDNYELIVIDDGSTDNTPEILGEYGTQIVRLQQINRGVGAARNAGIQKAKGDWIAFLDSDDLWNPEKISIELTIIEKYQNVGMIYSQAECIDDTGRRIPGQIAGYGPSSGLVKSPYSQLMMRKLRMPTCTVMARKELIFKCGCFKEQLTYQVEDAVLWARIMQRTYLYFIPATLARYRVHSKNYTSALNPLKQIDAKLEYFMNIHETWPYRDEFLLHEIYRYLDRVARESRVAMIARFQRLIKISSFMYEKKAISGAKAIGIFLFRHLVLIFKERFISFYLYTHKTKQD